MSRSCPTCSSIQRWPVPRILNEEATQHVYCPDDWHRPYVPEAPPWRIALRQTEAERDEALARAERAEEERDHFKGTNTRTVMIENLLMDHADELPDSLKAKLPPDLLPLPAPSEEEGK